MRKVIYLIMTLALLTGCANNEQTGQLLGGLGGAGLGGAIGSRFGRTGGLIGAGLGGIGGVLIGGAIGRSLDQRDQERVARATQEVLYRPLPYQGNAYQQPYNEGYAPQTSAPATSVRTPRRASQRSAPANAPSQDWASDHSGAHGSATVISSSPPTATSGECRIVHQTAYISGKEVSQDERYCVSSNNEWRKA